LKALRRYIRDRGVEFKEPQIVAKINRGDSVSFIADCGPQQCSCQSALRPPSAPTPPLVEQLMGSPTTDKNASRWFNTMYPAIACHEDSGCIGTEPSGDRRCFEASRKDWRGTRLLRRVQLVGTILAPQRQEMAVLRASCGGDGRSACSDPGTPRQPSRPNLGHIGAR
jgi:hypothetical protein